MVLIGKTQKILSRLSNINNFANHFAEWDQKKFLETLEKAGDSVFGVEHHVQGSREGIRVDNYIVCPPHASLRSNAQIRGMQVTGEDLSIYEGHLLKDTYMPLQRCVSDEFADALYMELEKILAPGEKILIQWLFLKIPYKDTDRQLNALKKYDKYLQESGHHIQEVEDKLTDNVLRFQLKVAIESKNIHEDIVIAIEKALSIFDYYNGIRLYKSTIGNNVDYINNRVIHANSYKQFISMKELKSMFNLEAERSEHVDNVPKMNTNSLDELYSLLPQSDNMMFSDDDTVSEDNKEIINRVAESLKRVGIIEQSRIYNCSVINGVRLTVIQFDIPKNKKITQLQSRLKDIQAVLGISSLGIEQGSEPDTVRFTIPNENSSVVTLRELMERQEYIDFVNQKSNHLPFVVGLDEVNNPIYLSLSKLVHLMIAGTTGSGKSVFINSLALSLILQHTPEELKMIMIDPKQVELTKFNHFPHVDGAITNMAQAQILLKELVTEMEERYKSLNEMNAKNIGIYNSKVHDKEKMPYIVCIIDEYADLRDAFPKVEGFIGRLGQKARASGIHLILATQRPDVNIISGRIKAVIPNAISFNLNNSVNYRTVFGTTIPYSALMGRGDGVMKIEGYHKEFQRFQSPMVTPDEDKEDELYELLASNYEGFESANNYVEDAKISFVEDQEDEKLNELKGIIANTKETRIAPLRSQLGVKTETVTKLMGDLVEEGWLIKHDSKAKGYEIVVSDEELDKYKN